MSSPSAARAPWQRWAAWTFCLLIFAAIMNDVRRFPKIHTTMPTYRFASTQWWQGLDPYTADQHAGFLYFPQAAFLFTPFNFGPPLLGDFLWRAATFGLFVYALVRMNQFFLSKDEAQSAKSFFILCLLAVPCSLASLRNAQFDLPLAALIVLAAASIASSRWTAAAAWLCFAVALKPLAVVPLLLFGAIYWKLIPRIIVGMLIVIALPFLHWSPAYVAHEYVRCFETLMSASKGDEPKFSDLAALLSHVGYDPSYELKTVVRVIFALIFLGLGWMGVRRINRVEAAWVIGALSADYLMLFNPRTETCSYAFLGPWVASLALFYSQQTKSKWLIWALGFGALGLACDGFPKLGHLSIHDMTDRWLKPLIALLFLPVLIQFIFQQQKTSASKFLRSELS
jgi:hypothetical protein